MPKAGRYQYPTRDLDDCIAYMEKAHKVANALVISRENFAKAVGLSPKGGGFGLILSSLSMYGLADTGDANVRYTDLAKRILFGQAQERSDSKNEAIRKVILFADLFDRYGSNPDDGQIAHILREKAGVPIEEEAKIASEVGKLLKRNAQHLKSVGGEQKQMQMGSGVTMGGGAASGVGAVAGKGLFTVIADGLTIDVDNQLKLSLVEKIIEDAKKKLSQAASTVAQKSVVTETK